MRRLCFALLLLPSSALAYSESVHATLTQTALASALVDTPIQLDPISPTAVRALIDSYGRNQLEPALREEWVRRYPTPNDFDAWALKEFLMLAPASTVNNIDQNKSTDVHLVDYVATSARQPDDDKRNIDRLAYDAKRQPLADKEGQPVPADPALLNMGRLGVLSSQAHAHYGLAQVEFSSDSEVLKTDPKRFAVAAGYDPGPILTLAAEMNQIHTDLALIAALSGQPDASVLQWGYAGNGFHYLEDVGNQVHTVQVGLYDFFVDAYKGRMLQSFLTGGGYFGHLRSLASIGIDILTNHHTLGEELTEKHLLMKDDPVSKRLMSAMTQDDPAFLKQLEDALAKLGPHPEQEAYALVLTRTLIAVSAEEGDDLYRATRAIALPKWRDEGVLYDYTSVDPDTAVYPSDAGHAADYEAFWALQEKAFRRVGTVLRKQVALQQAFVASAVDATQVEGLRGLVTDRLIRRQFTMLHELETRRGDYVDTHTNKVSPPERMPGMLAVEVLLPLGVLGVWMIRRSRQGAVLSVSR